MDHIQRFINLIYEWTIYQSDQPQVVAKTKGDLGNSGGMPTLDTYENINSEIMYGSQKDEARKGSGIFSNKANLKTNQSPRFEILGGIDNFDTKDISEILKLNLGSNSTTSS